MIEGLDLEQLPAAVEAMLFVSDEPVGAVELAKMLDENVEEVEEALRALAAALEEGARGIQLREVAGGWRLFTHPAYHDLVERYVVSWDTRKLSSAALETLAIVAYLQPVTRAQVSAIRGVASDRPMATLVERGYLREAGTADAPGNPVLYATTRSFLEKYGLRSVDELPNLEEFAPDEKTAGLIRERLGVQAEVGEASFAAGAAPRAGEGGAGPADAAFGAHGAGAGPGAPDAPGAGASSALPDERDLPSADAMADAAGTGLFGVVDKIDFDALTFNTDDE